MIQANYNWLKLKRDSVTLLACKLASYTKDKKNVKRGADNSRLVDVRFNMQRNLHRRKWSWVGQRQLHALTHLPESYKCIERP